ncbi:MAG: SDR family NAD(P)-dependent oxidoreductase [Acidobacteriota bacterium]
MSTASRIAVVTGASAGIGAATVEALHDVGFDVHGGARRMDRLTPVMTAAQGHAHPLDVADPASIETFVEALPPTVDVLVNNAGFGLGLERVDEAVDDHWEAMYRTNVLGVLRMTRALLPRLRRAENVAHIVNVGSIAGFETYPGGAGYTASKHALRALTRTLRLELLGEPIRVTDVAPGMVETEFSLVRFAGDQERADSVYQGMEPLLAEDIADCIVWAATRPAHVNIDEIVVRPRDQATASAVHRRS